MTKTKVAISLAGIALVLPSLVSATTNASFGTKGGANLALYLLYGLTLAIIFAVIYNFWSVITSFGGIVGKGLNLIGSGIILLSAQIVLRTLGEFGFDYLKYLLRNLPQAYEIFHAVLQVVGLLLVVWGLKELASVYQKERTKKGESKDL